MVTYIFNYFENSYCGLMLYKHRKKYLRHKAGEMDDNCLNVDDNEHVIIK